MCSNFVKFNVFAWCFIGLQLFRASLYVDAVCSVAQDTKRIEMCTQGSVIGTKVVVDTSLSSSLSALSCVCNLTVATTSVSVFTTTTPAPPCKSLLQVKYGNGYSTDFSCQSTGTSIDTTIHRNLQLQLTREPDASTTDYCMLFMVDATNGLSFECRDAPPTTTIAVTSTTTPVPTTTTTTSPTSTVTTLRTTNKETTATRSETTAQQTTILTTTQPTTTSVADVTTTRSATTEKVSTLTITSQPSTVKTSETESSPLPTTSSKTQSSSSVTTRLQTSTSSLALTTSQSDTSSRTTNPVQATTQPPSTTSSEIASTRTSTAAATTTSATPTESTKLQEETTTWEMTPSAAANDTTSIALPRSTTGPAQMSTSDSPSSSASSGITGTKTYQASISTTPHQKESDPDRLDDSTIVAIVIGSVLGVALFVIIVAVAVVASKREYSVELQSGNYKPKPMMSFDNPALEMETDGVKPGLDSDVEANKTSVVESNNVQDYIEVKNSTANSTVLVE